MDSIGYPGVTAGLLIWPHLSDRKRKKITQQRLEKLVHYVKEKSPFFKEYYKNVPDSFTIEDLPVTTKPQMRENFDIWHTIREITWDECDDFTCHTENRGKTYHGTYPTATSGSTGHPIYVCLDEGAKIVTTMLSLVRDIKMKFPLTSIFLDEGFDACSAQIDSNTKSSRIAQNNAALINSQLPKEELVARLNAIKPKTIISYSSILYRIASYANELTFKPQQILASGEYLSHEAKKHMQECFGCSVKAMYACTETGPIASECECGHLHIHEDWVIVEAVDENNAPVPSGTLSDKVLVTSLSNFAQPIIRYELTDRIILHDEPCECGKPGKWLEVEGRSNDILTFNGENGPVEIPSIMIFEAVESHLFVEALTYQVVLHRDNKIEFRVTPADSYTKEELYELIHDSFIDFLQRQGVSEPKLYLSETEPQKATANGKIKRFYQDDLDYEG